MATVVRIQCRDGILKIPHPGSCFTEQSKIVSDMLSLHPEQVAYLIHLQVRISLCKM